MRPHIPWYLRWSLVLPFLLGAAALIWFAYDSGLKFAGFHQGETQRELEGLHLQVARLSAENAALSGKVAQFEQQIRMEQGRSQETVSQMKALAEENNRLQEDLNFFQNLTSASGKEGELAIHRLTLERDRIPGEYRVRMLLVQGGKRVKEFEGGYQLVATIVQNGRKISQLFPSSSSGLEQFQVKFKYYQRLEQNLRLSPDAQLQSIQVRFFESGAKEARVRQSADLL